MSEAVDFRERHVGLSEGNGGKMDHLGLVDSKSLEPPRLVVFSRATACVNADTFERQECSCC